MVENEQQELTLDYPDFTLVGHKDGDVRLSGELLDSSKFGIIFVDIKRADLDLSLPFLLEVKSLSFLEHQRWLSGGFDAFPWYASQSTCYERASGNDLMAYAIKDRSGGARRMYIIKGERASMPAIVDRLQTVSQYISNGQLAPAELDLDSIECRRFCAFREALCSPDKATVDDVELVQAAHNYAQGRRMETDGKVLADEGKAILIEFARTKQLNRWHSGPYDVSYSRYFRETISIRGLEEIMERSLFSSAVKSSPIDRVRVINTEEEG